MRQRTPVIQNTTVYCSQCDHWNPGPIMLQIQHQQGKHNTLPWCQRWQVTMTLCLQTIKIKLKVRCCPKRIRNRFDLDKHKEPEIESGVPDSDWWKVCWALNLIDREIDNIANDIKEVTVEEVPGRKRRKIQIVIMNEMLVGPMRRERETRTEWAETFR